MSITIRLTWHDLKGQNDMQSNISFCDHFTPLNESNISEKKISFSLEKNTTGKKTTTWSLEKKWDF